jgi:D-glycero-D-manno-heptose 1,7-bisphosphate phosphatase
MKNGGVSDVFTDSRLGEDLLWRDLRRERFSRPVPALFLDRDGVIIEEKEYISDPNEVLLLKGVPELIRAARTLGMAVVEITNQAGIGRGYFQWTDFAQVEDRVTQVLVEQGVKVDAVFGCPFHQEGRHPYCHPNHAWRKPNPGMLFEAAKRLNLSLRQSVLVGDKTVDLEAARAAGLEIGVHVLTGHGEAQRAASHTVAAEGFRVNIISRADEAVPLLLENNRRWGQQSVLAEQEEPGGLSR